MVESNFAEFYCFQPFFSLFLALIELNRLTSRRVKIGTNETIKISFESDLSTTTPGIRSLREKKKTRKNLLACVMPCMIRILRICVTRIDAFTLHRVNYIKFNESRSIALMCWCCSDDIQRWCLATEQVLVGQSLGIERKENERQLVTAYLYQVINWMRFRRSQNSSQSFHIKFMRSIMAQLLGVIRLC